MIARWPGKIPAGKVENGIISGLDLFPTLGRRRRQSEHQRGTAKRKATRRYDYKVFLDGYDQTNLITGKGPSNRHEIFYFAEGTLGAVRIDD